MKVFCIISDERAFHSRSPVLFSAILNRVGIKGAYVPFKVNPANIGQAVHSLRILNIDGANVTVPYKEAVIPYLDILSEGARIIGAVNTIVRKGEILKGYNTNAIGFMDALSMGGFNVDGKSAIVFGTGGAAKAVVFILSWLRAGSIIVVGRNEAETKRVAVNSGGEAVSLYSLMEQTLSANLIVNATSVSSNEESPELGNLVGSLKLSGCELLMDLNYGRPQNFWQVLAVKNGIPFMDGRSALAHQARRSFALWTGLQVPPEEFLKVLQNEVI
ncbi:MAG: shikimate dehydrogenase [Thermodesulfobacteriota bacterium]